MKLLSNQELANKRQAEQARDVFRIEQIRETLNEETSRLNILEAQFHKRLNEQRKQWADEEAKALGEIERLQKILSEYETKERSFFFPIDAVERKAHDNYEKSKHALIEAQKTQKECDELEDKLQEKLDDLSEKEADLNQREKKIVIHEQGIRDQQNQTKQLSQELVKEWQKFHERSKLFEEESAKERKIIELARQDLARREDELLEQQEQVRVEKIRLLDGRETLTRAWAELERKQHG